MELIEIGDHSKSTARQDRQQIVDSINHRDKCSSVSPALRPARRKPCSSSKLTAVPSSSSSSSPRQSRIWYCGSSFRQQTPFSPVRCGRQKKSWLSWPILMTNVRSSYEGWLSVALFFAPTILRTLHSGQGKGNLLVLSAGRDLHYL